VTAHRVAAAGRGRDGGVFVEVQHKPRDDGVRGALRLHLQLDLALALRRGRFRPIEAEAEHGARPREQLVLVLVEPDGARPLREGVEGGEVEAGDGRDDAVEPGQRHALD